MASYSEIQKNKLRADAQAAKNATHATGADTETGDQQIPIDGFAQVVAMLRAADPAFRESLLARLTRKDPRLGRSLRDQVID